MMPPMAMTIILLTTWYSFKLIKWVIVSTFKSLIGKRNA